jgi:hypothetical protein
MKRTFGVGLKRGRRSEVPGSSESPCGMQAEMTVQSSTRLAQYIAASSPKWSELASNAPHVVVSSRSTHSPAGTMDSFSHHQNIRGTA